MVLGLNHPRGPLEWGDLIGPEDVVVLLRALHEHYGEERYRTAPRLLAPCVPALASPECECPPSSPPRSR